MHCADKRLNSSTSPSWNRNRTIACSSVVAMVAPRRLCSPVGCSYPGDGAGVAFSTLDTTSCVFSRSGSCPLMWQRGEPHHVAPLALPHAVRSHRSFMDEPCTAGDLDRSFIAVDDRQEDTRGAEVEQPAR